MRMLFALVFVSVFVRAVAAPDAGGAASTVAARPIVILVSIDGFRWDYLTLHEPPVLRRLAAEGAHARRLIPSFPSKTFPSHYTLVTGLWPARHGIVGNEMFDPEWNAIFRIGAHPSARESRWWEGEPIWTTVERQGLIAACFFWPGSDARIGGRNPTFWKPYAHDTPIEARVAGVLAWLDLPEEERPSLITLYFHHVDSAGHRSGPRSRETREAVRKVDAAIGSLVDGIAERGLNARTNLVIVSDHGMTDVSTERVIIIDDYIDPDAAHVDFDGTVGGLRPHELSAADLRDRFRDKHPRLRAFLVEELPERFHFSGHRRIPPVILLPDEGWEVATRAKASRWNPATMKGAHGYDPELPDMGALFIGHGPAFREQTAIERADGIDVYHLLCAILAIDPAPNDGSDALAQAVLRDSGRETGDRDQTGSR